MSSVTKLLFPMCRSKHSDSQGSQHMVPLSSTTLGLWLLQQKGFLLILPFLFAGCSRRCWEHGEQNQLCENYFSYPHVTVMGVLWYVNKLPNICCQFIESLFHSHSPAQIRQVFAYRSMMMLWRVYSLSEKCTIERCKLTRIDHSISRPSGSGLLWLRQLGQLWLLYLQLKQPV